MKLTVYFSRNEHIKSEQVKIKLNGTLTRPIGIHGIFNIFPSKKKAIKYLLLFFHKKSIQLKHKKKHMYMHHKIDHTDIPVVQLKLLNDKQTFFFLFVPCYYSEAGQREQFFFY